MASNQNQTSIRAVFGALFLALWLAALDQTVISTALPTMVADLGGLSYLSWVVTAYLLTSTVAGPLYGKFGDLYGRKIVLQVAIAVFLVGSALCGIAQNMMQLIVFRAIEGVGGGGLIVITISVIGDLIPPRERGRYQGFFGAVFGTATIVGPLVGGFLVDQLSWRWIFYINLPTGILAMAVIAAVLPSRSTRRRHAIDYAGALLLTAALSAIILFTGLGGTTFPWSSPVMLGLLAAGVAGTNLHEEYITAVMAALRPVFLVAAAISAVGFALAWMLREYPLREGAPAEGMGESFAMPRDATSLEELERIITLLVARENRWRLYADLARRAGVDLPAPELWMLARLGERAPITLASLSAELNIPQGQLAPPLDALCARGIAEKTTSGELELTSTGVAMRDRIVAARRQNLADMLARWRPEQHPDVLALIERMAQALTSDLPAPKAA